MKGCIILFAIALTAIACHKDQSIAATPIKFSNVLILGNSITYSPADGSLGWYGNWGMAATVADSDYVHILTAKFKQQNDSCKVVADNIAVFETGFATYDLNANLQTYRDSKPDLLIIRIGENIQTGFDTVLFNTKYAALVSYFKATNPNIRVFAAGSFWPGRDGVDAIMKQYSPFLSLSYLSADLSNYSFGLWANSAVQQHPSNKGMKAISNAMWPQIEALK